MEVVGALDKGPVESGLEVERAARVAAERVRKMDAGLAVTNSEYIYIYIYIYI